MKKRASYMNKKEKIMEEFQEEQVLLSNERTLLSYVRTSLTALVFGFALLQFAAYNSSFTTWGTVAIAAGICILIVGTIYYEIRKKKIKEIENEAEDD
jgi:uncharacterized membrane protein YidH (DUF202 family)